jgi:hypothetical protein
VNNHVLTRWGTSRLDAISGLAVHTWGKKLRAEGYAQATVTTIVKIMTMMLADATDERLIPVNPIQDTRQVTARLQPDIPPVSRRTLSWTSRRRERTVSGSGCASGTMTAPSRLWPHRLLRRP